MATTGRTPSPAAIIANLAVACGRLAPIAPASIFIPERFRPHTPPIPALAAGQAAIGHLRPEAEVVPAQVAAAMAEGAAGDGNRAGKFFALVELAKDEIGALNSV